MLEEAISKHGKPHIVNSDQGAQYTRALWTQYLGNQGIWKSIKYDHFYLNPAEYGFELYKGVQNHIAYYNDKTHHTTKQSPNNRYLESNKKAA